MIYKKKIVGKIKKICLKTRLKNLEKRRLFIIESYIASNPSQASRVDDIETKIHSDEFEKIKKRINLLNRYFRIKEK